MTFPELIGVLKSNHFYPRIEETVKKNKNVITGFYRDWETGFQSRCFPVFPSHDILQNNEFEMYKLNLESQEKELDRELTQYKIDSDNETKIAVAEIGNYFKNTGEDLDNDGIPDPLEIASQALEERKHASEVFNKSQDRTIKEKEIKDKHDLERRRIDLEEKKLKATKELQIQKDKAAMDREKLKAKTAIRNKVSGEGKKK